MSNHDPWTIGRLLNWTVEYLKQHGSESPQLDAQLLLAHARKCPRIELFTSYEQEPSESERAEFRELVKRRATGMPVAYLIGHREFYSLDFHVTNDVLIPRPETEFLVIAVTDLVKDRPTPRESYVLADVGTGSGNLAACFGKHIPRATIWATDISQAALEVARENCRSHGVLDRVHFCQGDLLAPIPGDVWFDFVVSNPPYVSESEFAQLPRDVREYEPRQALLAGKDGLDVIERLIPQAAERLKPGGWLLIEISPMLEQAVYERLDRDGRFAQWKTVRDLAGHARVIQALIPL